MGMGRPRSKARAGWPDNLYPNRDGFKYRHPVNRKETWMGRDKAKAFAAAKKLNALLAPTNDLVARVSGEQTIGEAVAQFRAEEMKDRKWAAVTAEGHEITLRRIERGVGNRPIAGFTPKDCAKFIRNETESARSRQNLRLVMGWVWEVAMEEGWAETNVPLLTRKFAYERKRDRLTLDAYKAVHAKAEPWLRNAMDLSLLTLLRREDVASLRFEDVREGSLWVVPSKTEDTTLVKLCIALTPDLEAIIARCRDAVVSPFLIHRLPERNKGREAWAKGRTHHTQVLPEKISREFQEAREAAGITGKHAPTFHEIRSLGGALLREAGWPLDAVQALMGHASETMTKVYLAGHDAPWQRVTPGLSLPGLG